MGATPVVNDILSVKLGYKLLANTDAAYNILHYKVSVLSGTLPAMGTYLSAIAQAMYNKFSALWKVNAGADVEMAACTVQSVFAPPRSVANTYVPGTAIVGTGGAESIPLQDAPTLLKTTDFGQRWGLGRLFYVGLAEALQNDGEVTAGSVAAFNAFANSLADPVVVAPGAWSATLMPVLLSGPEDNPTRQTPITGGRLSGVVIKGQRRRRPGKGT